MWELIGLDDLAERVYRQLVQVPSADAAQLSAALGEESTRQVMAALETLERKGLIARSSAFPEQLAASPPGLALGSLIVEHREQLRRAEQELDRLNDLYRGSVGRTVTDVLDVVSGPAAVAQRFAQLQRGATEQVLAFVRAEVILVSSEQNAEAEATAARRGVEYKAVLEREVLQRPGVYADIAESVGRGEHLRIVERVPTRMLIADRELALLPLSGTEERAGEIGALLIHPSGLLDALLALFDAVYESGTDVAPALQAVPGAALDESDTGLLWLLLNGLTDKAVAGQLGMSMRTVQRRVHELMELAGVDTRIQLGFEASRRGWITPGALPSA
ncbi:hypothetical protein [Microbacterium sp. NPDC057650]|uniref:hypothetical protein n=1 Tax=unclassified Microbacterium TaxID=2609290 RepID=UPI00366AD69A